MIIIEFWKVISHFRDFITKKTGIIDKNYNILRMDDYNTIRDDRMVDYNIIYLKKDDQIEIIQQKTYETKLNVKFKPGVLKTMAKKTNLENK